MDQHESKAFARALKAVCEVTRTSLSEDAIEVWWNALSRYPFEAVKAAFNAYVQDPDGGHYQLRPSDIIGRLVRQDGRPGAEEAWATVAPALDDESRTVVWTEEMQVAFGAALGLADDRVAARMTFTEVYRREVAGARAAGKPIRWQMSLGTDALGREGPLEEAVRLGRLAAAQVAGLLPVRAEGKVLALVQAGHKVVPK